MKVITVKNRNGDVWHLYPTVMVSKKSFHAMLRIDLRRLFNDKVEAKVLRCSTSEPHHIFEFKVSANRLQIGCQSWDRANTRILRKWAAKSW
jgi:hypothetical protein